MKTFSFLLFAIVLLPMLSFGQTCFTGGMEWRTQLVSTADPTGRSTVEVSTLEEAVLVDGYEALKMYSMYENEPESKAMKYYVRTDNDRVFFKLPGSTSGAWYLMYDFGLTAGQGCYVYSPVFAGDGNEPLRSYVKCVNIGTAEAPDVCLMEMEEFKDESCVEPTGKGTWLKGISSENGVDYNIGFGMDGIGTLLLSAKNGSNVLFSRNTTSISNVPQSALKYHVEGLNLVVSGVMPGDKLQICQTDGTVIGNFIAKDTEVSIRLPKAGLYILRSEKNVGNIVIQVF